MTSRFWLFTENTNANMSTMLALAAVPLLGGVGVAIDSIRVESVRTELAAALDGAVLAGAAAESDHQNRALSFFDANFTDQDVVSVTRNFVVSGTTVVSGTATAELEPSLTSILGFTELNISISSAATSTGGTVAGSSMCLMSLAPSASQAFLVNSGADVDAPDCEIHVKSTANPAAIFNSGSTLDTDKICIQGNNIIDNGGIHPNMTRGCTTTSNPFAGALPVPPSATCDYSNMNFSGVTTLNPGTYCGWHNFNSGSSVNLNPGTYVIKNGGWNVNGGRWDGDGVTFYYADTSKIQFNSAVAAELTAPTTGPYKGFLFAETEGLSDSQFIINDNRGFLMEGNIYLPSRELVFNSGSSVRSQKITAVARTVILNDVRWELSGYGGSSSSSGTKEVRLTD